MATAVANYENRSTYRLPLSYAMIPPLVVACIAPRLPAWVAAWLLALALFAMFKIWTLQNYALRAHVPWSSAIAYLFAWPGMDPRSFVARELRIPAPTAAEWSWAGGKTLLGVVLLWIVAPRLVDWNPLMGGWIGLVGLVFLLHFGLFHLLALGWRRAGVAVEPLMHAPILSTSVSDFWSRRWNLAFRDLAQVFFFRPFVASLGMGGAMMVVFTVSGLIHDLVISLPSGGGHGWPTLYFVMQGVAVLVEKSRVGRRFGLGRGARGRLFGWLVVVPGAYWLFHPPFVREVILPTLSALHVF